jgi:hypothetical protein
MHLISSPDGSGRLGYFYHVIKNRAARDVKTKIDPRYNYFSRTRLAIAQAVSARSQTEAVEPPERAASDRPAWARR